MDHAERVGGSVVARLLIGVAMWGGATAVATAAGESAALREAKALSELLAVGQRTTERPSAGVSTGPDVTVIYLTDVSHYTSGGAVDGYRAYSLGTTSCNIGTEPVAWCDDNGGCGFGMGDEDHPVIAQNLYRLKDGRFEQIGMSWLKHGFLSTNSNDANCGNCQQPPAGSDQLGVGCTDTYGSGLNGSRPLGMRSEVNATTGEFPFPYTPVASDDAADQRIKVLQDDLDPALNPGALYWMEGQYVTGDDALEGNGFNNASYEAATVSASYTISLSGPTVREVSALYAWQATDPLVEIVNVDVPGIGPAQRFEAARRVSQLADGVTWHYEIVVRNMNSDRSGRALTVAFAPGTTIVGAGFHDVDHHSGEPYSTADWTVAIDDGAIRWETQSHSRNPNANALRWATAFSFWFDADAPPTGAATTLELFKPGIPMTVTVPFAAGVLFEDGFESGDTGAWDATTN